MFGWVVGWLIVRLGVVGCLLLGSLVGWLGVRLGDVRCVACLVRSFVQGYQKASTSVQQIPAVDPPELPGSVPLQGCWVGFRAE